MLDQLKKIFTPEKYMQGALEKVIQNETIASCKERIQRILDLDITTLAKFLFIHESWEGASKTVTALSKEQKQKLLEEFELINLEENGGRVWMYNLVVKLCK